MKKTKNSSIQPAAQSTETVGNTPAAKIDSPAIDSPNSYAVGDLSNNISIQVSVSTVGIATTMVGKNNLNPPNVLVNSNNGTGIILPTPIGTGQALKNSTLIVMAMINLVTADPTVLTQAQQNIMFSFELTGGDSPDFEFTATPEDLQISSSGLNVVIVKQVELV